MSKLDIELSEFCATAIETYGRTEVCDAVCSLMAALRRRNLAQGNNDKHRSMVVESKA